MRKLLCKLGFHKFPKLYKQDIMYPNFELLIRRINNICLRCGCKET